MLDNFAKIIQSGKPVVLNNHTTLKAMGYGPPPDHPQAEFVDGSHGFMRNGVGFAKENKLSEFIDLQQQRTCTHPEY